MLLSGNQTAIPYCKILQVTSICHCILGHCSSLSLAQFLHLSAQYIHTPLAYQAKQRQDCRHMSGYSALSHILAPGKK